MRVAVLAVLLLVVIALVWIMVRVAAQATP